MKQIFKYLLIIMVNTIILTLLLAIWTDHFELTFNSGIRIIEFLKVIGFTLLTLILSGISILIAKTLNTFSAGNKILAVIIITLTINSYLYITYIIKIAEHRVFDRKIRTTITEKVKTSSDVLARGIRVEKLLLNEYEYISKTMKLPKLPLRADNITFDYSRDGFLPDYHFSMSYDLPFNTPVEYINQSCSNYSRYQSADTLTDKIKVHYEESQR